MRVHEWEASAALLTLDFPVGVDCRPQYSWNCPEGLSSGSPTSA